ncbi:MAG: indole-3-glycerol phosphate synthase TrpC [candidate division Zixibacteria bacterium]|nr:indole-3-glycerol phosphate synthase TrpC [candidate division Zixibacteria bacterium]
MILDEIIENKKIEVAESKNTLTFEVLKQQIDEALPPRDFFDAINPKGQLKIISEVKHASPSKGVFREDFDPVKIAESYSSGGASAISVLTDEKYFKGSLQYLKNIRERVSTPLLRKDFIVDPYQVYEARFYGADALLLIVAALDQPLLVELLELTHSLEMNAIVEVHDQRELDRALSANSRIIGINNRDLRTFDVDLNVSVNLSARVPSDRIVIAESGIGSIDDIDRLRAHGVHVFLIGETFMKAPDPGQKLKELIESSSYVSS